MPMPIPSTIGTQLSSSILATLLTSIDLVSRSGIEVNSIIAISYINTLAYVCSLSALSCSILFYRLKAEIESVAELTVALSGQESFRACKGAPEVFPWRVKTLVTPPLIPQGIQAARGLQVVDC
jgi:hypothetical protein